jgi:hypothetical protein
MPWGTMGWVTMRHLSIASGRRKSCVRTLVALVLVLRQLFVEARDLQAPSSSGTLHTLLITRTGYEIP